MMKKSVICVILICALLAGLWVSAEVQVMFGDVTGDRAVNATDALKVLKYSVGKEKLTDSQKEAADVTAEDAIDAVDALHILQYTVGKRNAFVATFVPDHSYSPQGLPAISGLEQVGGYQTDVSAFNYPHPVTLTQIGYGYDGKYDVNVDCLLGYASTSYKGNGSPYWSMWADKFEYGKDMVRGIMVPITRDGIVDKENNIGEYRKLHPERGMMDVQTDFMGNYMDHPTEDYYMVPTDTYIEYKWTMLKSHLDTGYVDIVALEEPEFKNKAGYSQGYQQAYEEYYGEEWVDFDLSPEAMYKNQYFKAYMFYHAVDVLSSRIKENYPHVEVYVASHSTLNYSNHKINSCLGMLASLDTVDGIIAQTWSDGANMSFQYNGVSQKNPFATALYEYNSYSELLREGQKLFLLQDPASDDGALSAREKEDLWQHTVVASMIQEDTAAFESPIWPGRSMGQASDEYKTVMLNAQRMFGELHKYDAKLYSGTKGIAFGMSDSAGWHLWSQGNITGNCLSSCTGVIYPLLEDGIAVDTVWLDNLTSVEQLKDVNLLILTYDVMKPLSGEVNQVIAKWVKEGGRLLYLGGTNDFNSVKDTWWGDTGVTPLEDLIDRLGLSVETHDDALIESFSASSMSWPGSVFDGHEFSFYHGQFSLSFTGSGFDTFLKAGNHSVGITAPCQKGQVTMVGITACYYAQDQQGSQMVRELAQLALKGSDTPYWGSSVFAAQRGNYFAVHALEEGIRLDENKTYLDLFDRNLTVWQGGTLKKGESRLFYDMTDAMKGETPVLVFSGDTLMEEKAYENHQSVYTLAAPTGATVASAFACNGKEVDSVVAVDGNGDPCTVKYSMDRSVLVVHTTVNAVKAPVTVTVNWK